MSTFREYLDTWTVKLLANSRGHVWLKNEDGSVDIFGIAYGYHNGPICELCDYGFCHHCQDLPSVDCPYTTTAANLNPNDLYELEQT